MNLKTPLFFLFLSSLILPIFGEEIEKQEKSPVTSLKVENIEEGILTVNVVCKRGRWIWRTESKHSFDIDENGINVTIESKDQFGHPVKTYMDLEWKDAKVVSEDLLHDEFGIELPKLIKKILSLKERVKDKIEDRKKKIQNK